MKIYGAKLLTDINAFFIEKWRTKRLESGIKAATVNKNISMLKAAMNKAVDWGFIKENLLEKLKPLKVDVISRVSFFSEEEDARIRKVVDNREENIRQARDNANIWRKERGYDELPDLRKQYFADHIKPMIVISRNTGIRRDELFAIDKEKDINLSLKILTVSYKSAKTTKTRHIPLNEEATTAIKQSIEQTGPSGLLFANKKNDNKEFVDIKYAWKSLQKEADIKNFHWHDLRHDFASRLVMAGVDLNTVRELLGHADIKMTLRYAHLAPKHKSDAVAKLDTNKEISVTSTPIGKVTLSTSVINT